MAVIRINKTSDYTVMSNAHFKENEMTLKAKGLLSLMLSLPDDWDYSISGLCAICAENESAIKAALSELKQFGYLTITKKMPNETESGRIEYEYDIYEKPQKQEGKKQAVENLPVENLSVEKQAVENQVQLNNNKSNTNKLNTNKFISNTNSYVTRFAKPTLEEVKAYCIERGNSVDAERFIDYYTANGWKVGRTPMKDWRAAVRTWERNNKKTGEAKNGTVKQDSKGEYDWLDSAFTIG